MSEYNKDVVFKENNCVSEINSSNADQESKDIVEKDHESQKTKEKTILENKLMSREVEHYFISLSDPTIVNNNDDLNTDMKKKSREEVFNSDMSQGNILTRTDDQTLPVTAINDRLPLYSVNNDKNEVLDTSHEVFMNIEKLYGNASEHKDSILNSFEIQDSITEKYPLPLGKLDPMSLDSSFDKNDDQAVALVSVEPFSSENNSTVMDNDIFMKSEKTENHLTECFIVSAGEIVHGEETFINVDENMDVSDAELNTWASPRNQNDDIMEDIKLNDDQGDGIIRCICGNDEDNGFTIQCEGCFVWQHAECVGIEKDNIPDFYYCEQCQGSEDKIYKKRKKHTKKARKSQEEITVYDHHVSDRKLIEKGVSIEDLNDSNESLCNLGSLDHDTQFEPINYLEVDPNSMPVIKSIWIDLLKFAMMREKESILLTSYSSLISIARIERLNEKPMPIEYRKTFTIGEKDYKKLFIEERRSIGTKIIKTKITTEYYLQSFLSSGGVSLTPYILERLEAQGNSRRFDFAKKLVVVNQSDRIIYSGQFITNINGVCISKSEIKNLMMDETNSIYTLQPYMFYHPSHDLAVDASIKGDITRFIRRSCRPNAEIKVFFILGSSFQFPSLKSIIKSAKKNKASTHDMEDIHRNVVPEVKFGLFATENIKPNEELFLPFDYEFGNSYYRYHCQCGNENYCLAEEPVPNFYQVAKSLLLNPNYNAPITFKKRQPSLANITTNASAFTQVKKEKGFQLAKNLKAKVDKKPNYITKKASNPHPTFMQDTNNNNNNNTKLVRGYKKKGKQEFSSDEDKKGTNMTSKETKKQNETDQFGKSREERKLQMLIESIQRNEERELKKAIKKSLKDIHSKNEPLKSKDLSSSSPIVETTHLVEEKNIDDHQSDNKSAKH